jgi:hypothetical protein
MIEGGSTRQRALTFDYFASLEFITSIVYTNSLITVITHSMTAQGVRSYKRLEMDLAKNN